jgi:hypothetical protein
MAAKQLRKGVGVLTCVVIFMFATILRYIFLEKYGEQYNFLITVLMLFFFIATMIIIMVVTKKISKKE